MILRFQQHEFVFPRPTLLMGIVNVTPDSFSDGGRFIDPEAAVAHALDLVRQGADILDIGGESTRPGSQPVEEAEERRRVLPVIRKLAGMVQVPISIDTMKPGVAAAAIEAGATLVNDIAANRTDDAMWRLVADTGVGYVCMHMQGTPATMQRNPVYADVVREVLAFFSERLDRLRNCGVNVDSIIVDPGIGFGKTAEHNLQLLASLAEFARLGRPLLLGVSRKSFIGKVAGADAEVSRVPGSLACASYAVQAGAHILRVHDVAETLQAVRMIEAILSRRQHDVGTDPGNVAACG
ncbi:MAG TPA: dihydropteroate synthase [Verrucomicrobia bacterium]|nr:dihydropteroate synthase [Verrucomicrobiota bacterium]HOB31829.1 dihydropteroate synthase [Verrucomicrobiota bacterium]HOP95815.1 dihydropteroate synthase [Verrucomicrobiota bacterium]